MRMKQQILLNVQAVYDVYHGKYWDKNESVASLLEKYRTMLSGLSQGDRIEFGTYKLCSTSKFQRNSVKKHIIWNVLRRDNSKLLLLSEYCLDWETFSGAHPDYCISKGYNPNDWNHSEIRKLLNTEYLNSWFTAEEQEFLAGDRWSDTDSGNKTGKDMLFLPDIKELPTDFDGQARIMYAEKDDENDEIILIEDFHSWWLRTPGSEPEMVRYFESNGCLTEWFADSDEFGIRPCLWLDMEAIDRLNIKLW